MKAEYRPTIVTQNDLCLRSEKQEYAWNRHNEFDTGDCVAEIELGRVRVLQL